MADKAVTSDEVLSGIDLSVMTEQDQAFLRSSVDRYLNRLGDKKEFQKQSKRYEDRAKDLERTKKIKPFSERKSIEAKIEQFEKSADVWYKVSTKLPRLSRKATS